jgi:hypothetical protein
MNRTCQRIEKRPTRLLWMSALLIVAGVVAATRHGKRSTKPLGEAPPIQFQDTFAQDTEVRQFLDGDFVIIRSVNALPKPVLKAFTEVGGSRPVIANPGEKFEATDFITDSSIPMKRLIFGGVSGDRCFVHYEQKGRGHSYILALFMLTSGDTMKPIWRGSCGPAANIGALRSSIAQGCSQP